MLEASFTFGIVIFIGLILLFSAMPLRLKLWCLRHHLFTSLFVSALTLWIHWGTMTGLMSATIAGMMTSLACLMGRWWVRIA